MQTRNERWGEWWIRIGVFLLGMMGGGFLAELFPITVWEVRDIVNVVIATVWPIGMIAVGVVLRGQR